MNDPWIAELSNVGAFAEPLMWGVAAVFAVRFLWTVFANA